MGEHKDAIYIEGLVHTLDLETGKEVAMKIEEYLQAIGYTINNIISLQTKKNDETVYATEKSFYQEKSEMITASLKFLLERINKTLA